MGIEENTTDSFPGAGAIADEPFSGEDCYLEATRAELAAELQARGIACTWKGGRLFIGATIAEVQVVCYYEQAEVSGVAPDPLVEAQAATVNGTKFGVKSGEVHLTENSSWAASAIKVEQSVSEWTATAIGITVVRQTLPPPPAHVYVFVEPTLGERNAVGFETELEIGAKEQP